MGGEDGRLGFDVEDDDRIVTIDVSGIRELSLVVDCLGDNFSAMAGWLDPNLSE